MRRSIVLAVLISVCAAACASSSTPVSIPIPAPTYTKYPTFTVPPTAVPPTATATAVSTNTSYPTYTRLPTATARPTDTLLPTATARPTDTPLPVATAEPTDTPVVPTRTPKPTTAPAAPSGVLAYTVNRATRVYDLYLINADGTGNRLLVNNSAFPSFSTDGQELMFYTWDGNGVDIMKRDGSHRRRFLNDGEAAYAHVGSDGYSVIYRAGNINWERWQFDLRIYVIGLDGSGKREITEGDQPDWNPKAMQFACRSCDGNKCGLFIINSDGSGRHMVSQDPDDQNPDWSPDGQRIAFTSHRDGNWEIYVMNADGSNPTRLTNDPGTDAVPVWLPDGKYIAFRSDRGGVWAIYLMKSDGTGVKKLINANADPVRWPWERMAVYPK